MKLAMKRKSTKRQKPISLYPLTLEEIVGAMLRTPLPGRKPRAKSRKGSKKVK